ncbi:MAG: HD domain-containing phosphohydrolase [Conexibacter sp.]
MGFAQALDLAEGRTLGHSTRVCYIALHLTQALELPDEQQRAAFYAALLHDAGAAPASAELCRMLSIGEEALFCAGPEKPAHQLALEISPNDAPAIVEALRAHPPHGARIARDLGFETAVQEAILSHHERWDGHGYPSGLKEDDTPLLGRIIATADLIESLISSEFNALTARRNLLATLVEYAETALDPELVGTARRLARSDAFWLGLHSEELNRELAAACPEQRSGEERSPLDLEVFATVFADLADGKGEHTTTHSDRTAKVADQFAESLGFSPVRRQALRVAGLLHDVGLLGVPARVIAKPDILSLAEMEVMRKHPAYSQMILEDIPGLEDVAIWIGAHHERPDGKGYPELLEDDTIPLEARILAVADTYVALTSARPYRKSLSHEDAIDVLMGGASTQLDASLVRRLRQLELDATSSRSAPRSRRKR